MFRSVVAGFAVAAASVALAACGSSSSSPTSSAAGQASSASASTSSHKHYKIAVIAGIATDPYYISLARGAKEAGAKLGATVTATGPQQFAPSSQIPVLESVIASKPDAILIAPTDPKALYAPLKSAVDQGIKVVLVDTTLANPSIAVSQVTSNNVLAGQIAANYLIKLVGGKGAAFVESTIPGVSTTDDRAKGWRLAIQKTGMKDLGIQYDTPDSAQQAASQTSAMLAAHSDLDGVFALNTFTGQGAATAIKQAGKLGKVKLVGFDANPSGVSALNSGAAQAEVVLKPLDEGYDGVVQALNALEGKPVQKLIRTGSIIATKANLNSAEVQKYLYKP